MRRPQAASVESRHRSPCPSSPTPRYNEEARAVVPVRMLGTVSDLPGADDDAPVVEDGCLSVCDAVRRLVELQPEAARGRLDACGDSLGAVTELDLCALDRHVQPTGRLDRRAGERQAGPDDDGVRAHIGAGRIERLRRRDAEPPPLPRGEAPVPCMAAELSALLAHDRALAGLEPMTLEERAIVVSGEEARLLTFLSPRDGEAVALRLGAGLGLRLLAEGEDDAFELRRIKPREHVRLILVRIGRAREQPLTAMLDDARVVPGREHVGARMAGEREQPAEAESAVAAHARIRRLAALVAAHERIDDGATEVLAQVERDVRDAERVARLAGRDHRFGRAARPLGVWPVGIEPEAERHPDRVGKRAQEGDGAVDSAAHRDRDAPG